MPNRQHACCGIDDLPIAAAVVSLNPLINFQPVKTANGRILFLADRQDLSRELDDINRGEKIAVRDLLMNMKRLRKAVRRLKRR